MNKLKQKGQGMTEYIIIVALIAIAAIGAFTMFGDVVRNQTASMAAELGGSGSEATKATNQATKQGKEAVTIAAKEGGLDKYNATAGSSIKN
ncbi:pilus assembly protein [Shewanella sp. CAL98-MNA-CIBAN-0140]|uniref:pilus assembly protein n=1 Tax=Shewanella sp. CAL98-MNA-CIBAN-0140 TaxID=3140462 RepID=UPI00332CB281